MRSWERGLPWVGSVSQREAEGAVEGPSLLLGSGPASVRVGNTGGVNADSCWDPHSCRFLAPCLISSPSRCAAGTRLITLSVPRCYVLP